MTKTEIVANLKEMLDDTKGAVQNEHIWALGAPNEEQASMHNENERNLEERVENLEIILKVLEGEVDTTEIFLEDAIEAVLEEEKLADTEYVEMFTELKEQYC